MKEIEYKFLLTPKDKKRLINFLEKNSAEKISEGTQDNFYYITGNKKLDFRIRRTDKESFLILKKGWMHDDDREEVEIKFDKKDFLTLDKLITDLGYKYDTKWYRKRIEYKYKNFNIDIDFNAGYGWLAEIEKLVKDENADKAKKEIIDFASEIGLKPTPKSTFDKMYKFYKKNWKHYYDSKEVFSLEEIK